MRLRIQLKTAQLVTIMALLAAVAIAAQQSQPAAPPAPSEGKPPKSPAAALNMLMAQLAEEAQQLVDDGTLPRAHPSIASEFPHELPEAQLAMKITKRQDRDPLIDAYIRWQLTSFDPPLPELKPRQAEQLLNHLPALALNPRADDNLIGMMNRALGAGELSESDLEKINATLESMNEVVSARRTLNTPAMELRDWLQEQYEDDLAMRILIALERCAALVSAGWPLGRHGADTERLFMDVARDRDFTDDDRKVVTRAVGRIVGMTRVYVGSARIVEDRLEVNFAETGIYDFDVRRWLRRMDGR